MKLAVVLSFVLVGCAGLGISEDPPELKRRTLLISRTAPALEYTYRVCIKKRLILPGCREWEDRVETYDLTDPDVRNRLRDMGFQATVAPQFLP